MPKYPPADPFDWVHAIAQLREWDDSPRFLQLVSFLENEYNELLAQHVQVVEDLEQLADLKRQLHETEQDVKELEERLDPRYYHGEP